MADEGVEDKSRGLSTGSEKMKLTTAEAILRAIRDTKPADFIDNLTKSNSGVYIGETNIPTDQLFQALITVANEHVLPLSGRIPEEGRTATPMFIRKNKKIEFDGKPENATLELTITHEGRMDRDAVTGEPVLEDAKPNSFTVDLQLPNLLDKKGHPMIIIEASTTLNTTPTSMPEQFESLDEAVEETGRVEVLEELPGGRFQVAPLDEMMSDADGFGDWREMKGYGKDFFVWNLRKVQDRISATNRSGIPSFDQCLDDEEWRRVAAGIFQGLRFMAANFLNWEKENVVLPEDLVDRGETNPLNYAGIYPPTLEGKID